MGTNLRVLRKELKPKVHPEEIALASGIRTLTYIHIEQGRRTTYTTANKILSYLNKARVERGLTEVVLNDLGLNIV
jgi:transcriptional regulator with XRE-family HTH domain